jgi:oxidase EvaA
MAVSQIFSISWATPEGIIPTSDILTWISKLNNTIDVDIRKTSLEETSWFYDDTFGQIVNADHSFFQISGFRSEELEQPLILQNEIGYLGFLCKEIEGVLHFLAQAKIEPGNLNKIQLSPTIQATKSNFTQRHGGAKPLYLNWFLNADKHTIIVDQIQSEQSSRFFKKRNRNIIIMLDANTEIEESAQHKWLTLGQLKQLMKIDNLVNMDSRTVLSCIPFYSYKDSFDRLSGRTKDIALVRSISNGIQVGVFPKVFNYINNYKMLSDIKSELVPLYSLNSWNYVNNEFICDHAFPFKVVFCNITIEGREVRQWGQPLFEGIGKATFGLFTTIENEIRYFLVKAHREIGCFDFMELGPTIQLEASEIANNPIAKLFLKKRAADERVLYDVLLSEEGGRFYHEQNINCVIEIDKNELNELPPGYFWLTYHTLNSLTQINNVLNIQLRNLLSLLEI